MARCSDDLAGIVVIQIEENAGEKEQTTQLWRTPRAIARILGLLLFGLLLWLQSPPTFLRGAGIAAHIFAFLLWIGELLVHVVIAAGVLVILIFAGSYVYNLLRNARRWFRLQEIRSWRAKRPCNFPGDPKENACSAMN